MRTAQPALTHKPKDFCTIEQASYISQEVLRTAPMMHDGGPEGSVLRAVYELRARVAKLERAITELQTPWYRRLWR